MLFFSPLLFRLASWIRKFSWENYMRFVFLMFSQTIHALPGISQELQGDTPPAWTKLLVILGEISHFQQLEQEQDVGFLALAAFFLGKVGKDQEGGGEGVPGGSQVVGAGDGDARYP